MYVKLELFGYSIAINGQQPKQHNIYGYTNRCDDGKFILFLDYDDLPIEWIKKEIEALQETYEDIGDVHLLSSSECGTHVVCFTKFTMTRLLIILHNSSVDMGFIKIPFVLGKRLLTLRLSAKGKEKIKYLGCLKHTSLNEESKPHKELFQNLFNCMSKEQFERNNDTCENIIISNYKVK